MNKELSGYTLIAKRPFETFSGENLREGDEYASVVNHWVETGTIELNKPFKQDIDVTNDSLVQQKLDSGKLAIQ